MMKNLHLTIIAVFSLIGLTQAQTGNFERSFIANSTEISGDTLNIYFYIPTGFDFNQPATVIVGQHGLGTPDNSMQIRTFLTPVGDSMNAIVMCPDPYLQDQPRSRAALNEAIDSALTWYNINQSEMYIVGYSAGSDVAAQYVFETPEHPMKGLIWHSPGFFATPDMNNQATFPPVCLCWGSSDFVSILQNGTLDNTFSGSNVPYHHITMSGVGHTMDYPEFPAVMLECIDFIDANSSTGITENQLQGIEIYPNPIGESQDLILKGLSGDALITLTDISGKCVKTFTFNNINNQLIISNISNDISKGIYTLSVLTEGGVFYQKLIIGK